MKGNKIAVVLAAHGEAETAGFFENYRVSRHTLMRASTVMHIPPALQQLISISSSIKKKRGAGAYPGGSPQNGVTRAQAVALQRYLDQYSASSGIGFEVRAAYSASEPYVEEVLSATSGYAGQVLVPMAPVDNSLSCGLHCRHIAEAYAAGALHRVKVLGRLWSDDALCGPYLDHLFGRDRRVGASASEKKESALMLLFHGTLVRDKSGAAPAFHTGLEETLSFAAKLTSAIEADVRNPWGTVRTAYLNHDVGGEWTRPSFEEACRTLISDGAARVSLFAAGYFADGNETIRRAAFFADTAPAIEVESIPCLNDSPAFTSYLARRVAAAAAQILRFSGDSRADAVRIMHAKSYIEP
jgi:ferrochelatase